MINGRRIVIWIIPLLALLGLSSGSALAQKAAPPPAAPPPAAPPAAAPPAAPAAATAPYEVWVIDQSDSSKDGGGTLYIYDGESLAKDAKSAKAEKVDLGDKFAEACKEAGGYPKRPHMIFFTKDGKYAILSYVASGHVVFLDAAARAPIGCVSLGKNAHATFPAADMNLAIGANIAEKKLVRIDRLRKQKIHSQRHRGPGSLGIGGGAPRHGADLSDYREKEPVCLRHPPRRWPGHLRHHDDPHVQHWITSERRRATGRMRGRPDRVHYVPQLRWWMAGHAPES